MLCELMFITQGVHGRLGVNLIAMLHSRHWLRAQGEYWRWGPASNWLFTFYTGQMLWLLWAPQCIKFLIREKLLSPPCLAPGPAATSPGSRCWTHEHKQFLYQEKCVISSSRFHVKLKVIKTKGNQKTTFLCVLLWTAPSLLHHKPGCQDNVLFRLLIGQLSPQNPRIGYRYLTKSCYTSYEVTEHTTNHHIKAIFSAILSNKGFSTLSKMNKKVQQY